MMKKRIVNLLIALALCLSLATPAFAAAQGADATVLLSSAAKTYLKADGQTNTGSTPSFSDVKPGSWCYDFVNWALEHGITSGTSTTTFSPDQTCTHAQILTFLWRASGSPVASDSNPYQKAAIAPDKYYYDALLWAWGQGLILYDTFDPNTPCKRRDVVTYLWTLSGSPIASGRTFSDVSTNDVSASAVAWAVDTGITAGTTATTFGPNQTCTRGHIVTFLYRFFESWEGTGHVNVHTQNELNALPDRVDAERIKEITAVNAGISDLSVLRQLPHLTYLQLFFNLDIGSLEPLRGLTELTYLDLSADGVKDISALSGLKKLTYLDLGGNGTIKDLTPLYGLKNLKELNLDFDHITQEQADALQAQLPGCKIKW